MKLFTIFFCFPLFHLTFSFVINSLSEKKTPFANLFESFLKLSQLKIDFTTFNSTTELSLLLTNNNQISFVSQFSPKVSNDQILCASIKFQDLLNKIGFLLLNYFSHQNFYKKYQRWDTLTIKTYAYCDPIIQMWAAGLLEGLVTYQKMNDFYLNLLDIQKNSNK